MSSPERRALGSDPFTHGDGTLPYLIRLRNRTFRIVRPEYLAAKVKDKTRRGIIPDCP